MQPVNDSSVSSDIRTLRGRRSECAALNGLLAAARRGESGSLVLYGDAGVGKTALLDYAVQSATDLQQLRAGGVQSEMELAFAALHQLCAPILDRLDHLPVPQRDALRTVFGLSPGTPPDPFLVGLAVLGLLSDVAEEQPLLCVIDDAQWLDMASARTLGFVARRLRVESVALVLAARQLTADVQGLPELEIRGLRNRDARALLASVLRFHLDERVRERIVAETKGNPLALLELPRGLNATELAGGFGLLDAQALSGHIEESFVRRLDELAEPVRQLLLIAAAEPLGDPLLLWRAAELLGVEASSAAPLEASGLLTIGHLVTFRHPLVRSAVYHSAPMPQRRVVHLALAEVTDPQTDPDRRAWHLAAATSGPDENVARELEQSAGRAQARGGFAAAAAFLQRSVALTLDPARRASRALTAAQLSVQAGVFDIAFELLTAAETGPLDELQRARLDLLRAEAAFSQNRGSDAPPLLLRAAKTLETLDARLGRETYLDAWSAALFAGRLASSGGLADVSRAALAGPGPPQPPHPSDLLLDGFSLLFTEGRAAAAPVLERAAARFASEEVPTDDVLRWGWVATAAAVVGWRHDTCLAVATRGVELAREAGALAVLAVALNVLTQAVVLAGDFAKAALLVAEADAVTEATGSRVAGYGSVVLAGFRGRAADASGLIDATISEATAAGQGTAVQYAWWARSMILNAHSRYDEALAAAQQASDAMPELWVSAWALSELVEAATRSERFELAREAHARLLAHTAGFDTDWARGITARSKALLSGGDAADRHFQDAIGALSRTQLRPELARVHLLYGEALRREGRRIDARTQLRTAYDMFAAIGMEGFADRARRERLATGETVRKRTVATRDDLTPQELQIALLARDGMSNPEVGARLFISPRTVEWHLRKVFTKLAIGSRKELRAALSGSEYEPVPGPVTIPSASA